MLKEDRNEEQGGGTLGTFAGVFTPSVLTILGIILFLRTGYVIGSAGLAWSLLIIAIANLISVLTTVSLSAIATNLRVKSGGDYYLISRTLGPEFGGAIGIVLFLAQAVSIAFYCIGFGEVLGSSSFFMEAEVSPRLIAVGAAAFLFVFAWLGADWATKFQYVVMTLLAAALVSFFIGGISQWEPSTFAENWSKPENGLSFWVLFALFFPAVTGFTQGVSMSGDLRNPGKSLPLGTFLAVGVSIAVYFGAAFIFSGALTNEELTADYQAMNRIARFSWLIDAGVIAATLSSAMASFLGAPRIMQSLAADKIFPFLHIFAKGEGAMNNPRRAVLLAAGIACLTISLGNLNLIAPVVSMFFLISYGLLNYATYYEAKAASPSFRPTFKFFDRRLSLVGCLACLGVMLAIDPTTGVIAIAIIFAIYQYLRRTAEPARWADSSRAHHLQKVRENLIAAGISPHHPRDWRPQLLAFSEEARRRPRLLRLAGWLEGGSGLTTVATILEGKPTLLHKKKEEVEKEILHDISEHNHAAFPLVLTAEDTEAAIQALLQAHGIGPLRANTILLNWFDRESKASVGFRELLFGRQLKTLYRLGCNIVMLSSSEDTWNSLLQTESHDARIDIWWSGDATGKLMLLFAYLMTRSEVWKGAGLRVIIFPDERGFTQQKEEMGKILSEARIKAEVVCAPSMDVSSLIEVSRMATLVFLPFHFQGNLIKLMVEGYLEVVLEQMVPTVLVSAAEDIDLDAEPEEGLAAVLAKARDLHKKREKLAEIAEKKAGEAEQALTEVSSNLQEAESLSGPARDPETIAALTKAKEKALAEYEKAHRREIKMRTKAEEAKENIESGELDEQGNGEGEKEKSEK